MSVTPISTASQIATLTVSDSRDPSSDTSGQLLRELMGSAGFKLTPHAIVKDDVDSIRQALSANLSMAEVAAVVMTGGTGISARDVTIEAIQPWFIKTIEGFGEAFRRLSWEQVGARSILSRATAGVVQGRLVFALPGSPKAVRLGVEQLIVPMLSHALHMLAGAGHSAHEPASKRDQRG
jgi:molybdopterin adenylyltransferase